jgi:hypothetical protein
MKPANGRNKEALNDSTAANVPAAICRPAMPVNPSAAISSGKPRAK